MAGKEITDERNNIRGEKAGNEIIDEKNNIRTMQD